MNLHIDYGNTNMNGYTEGEDRFLLCSVHRLGFAGGFGEFEHYRRIRMEIRTAWQFRFNIFFRARSPVELQKRGDLLVRLVERQAGVGGVSEEQGRGKGGSKGGSGGRRGVCVSWIHSPTTELSTNQQDEGSPRSPFSTLL